MIWFKFPSFSFKLNDKTEQTNFRFLASRVHKDKTQFSVELAYVFLSVWLYTSLW